MRDEVEDYKLTQSEGERIVRVDSVSYTHLDVYKRQKQLCLIQTVRKVVWQYSSSECLFCPELI